MKQKRDRLLEELHAHDMEKEKLTKNLLVKKVTIRIIIPSLSGLERSKVCLRTEHSTFIKTIGKRFLAFWRPLQATIGLRTSPWVIVFQYTLELR